MKRFFTILILMIVLGAGFIQLVYKDQFDLIEYVKELARGERGEVAPEVKSEAVRVINDGVPADSVDNPNRPEWMGDTSKNRWLNLQYEIGREKGTVQFRNAIALDFDAKGNLFVLDFGNKSIEVFDTTGKYIRTLGIGENRVRYMSKPTDLAIDKKGRVYVSDRRKGVLIFAGNGRLLRAKKVPYEIAQIALDSRGQIIALAPAHQYMLHKFTAKVREFLVFAPQDETDKALRKVFGDGKLAIDSEDNVYVSKVNPYEIVKFNSNGQPLLTFNRDLDMPINPATIIKDEAGNVKQVIRQEVAYDLEVGTDGLIYNLVRTKGVKGGNLIDVFSPKGTYLQSFYLKSPALSFALFKDLLALLSPLKFQEIKTYRIGKIN